MVTESPFGISLAKDSSRPLADLLEPDVTLICCLVNSSGYLALGDLVVSHPRGSDPTPMHLPLSADKVAHQAKDDEIFSLLQKLIVRNRTVLQWSGSVAVSRAICRLIMEKSGDGHDLLDLHETLQMSGLADAELSQVGLIYSYFNPQGSAKIQTHNCTDRSTDSTYLFESGNGAWPFFDVDTGTAPLSGEHFIKSFITQAIYNLCSEKFVQLNYDFLYGGWFEFCKTNVVLPEKIPYAIVFWQKSPCGVEGMHDLNFAGLTYSSYIDQYLVIVSLDAVEGQQRRRTFAVGNFLSSGVLAREIPQYEPAVVFHVVNNEPFGSIYADTTPDNIKFEFEGSGVRSFKVEKELMERLSASLDSGDVMRRACLDWSGGGTDNN